MQGICGKGNGAGCYVLDFAEGHCEGTGKVGARGSNGGKAYPMLLQQCYRPMDGAALQRTLELLDRLSGAIRFYRLSCNMDPEAARVAYEAMSVFDGKDGGTE